MPKTSATPSSRAIDALVTRHGERHRTDIERGVNACARVWESDDPGNDLVAFCVDQYVPEGRKRKLLLERLDEVVQAVSGSMGAAVKILQAGQDIADRPDLPAETVLAAFRPGTHLSEDLRRMRIAPLVQLNFGRNGEAKPPRTRTAWAAYRLGKIGRTVVPAPLLQARTRSESAVDRFVSSYNLHLENIRFEDPDVRFPKGTRLISHWGLRDYMTSLNGQPGALPKQRAILDLMRRVVDGEIPAEILDDPGVTWSIPEGRIRRGTRSMPATGHGPLRWEKFRAVWRDQLTIDPHTTRGNLIDEKFLEMREMPEKDVVDTLETILASPLAERIGRFVRDRVGRDLEPFDVYFRDFTGNTGSRTPLRVDIRKRYPSAQALQDAIPGILVKLGWTRSRARWIASHIRVDNARSAGHAWPPSTAHDTQLLRVRVDAKGCDELSFDTFMHELGHAVEGVLSSYEMDYHVLWSVPNTAFTEGFAFTFEDHADRILGRRATPDRDAKTLHLFWEPFEIAGPALTEIRFFHWLYAHPDATAEEMMAAVRRIGDEIWSTYYARIFGDEGHGLMSVYSHMLWCDFYLADYPMGYVIAYQVRKHLEKHSLAEEMERMCSLGRVAPQTWMRAAVGAPVSVTPLLDDAARALDRLGY